MATWCGILTNIGDLKKLFGIIFGVIRKSVMLGYGVLNAACVLQDLAARLTQPCLIGYRA